MLMNLDNFTYLRQISAKPHIIDKSGQVFQIETSLNYFELEERFEMFIFDESFALLDLR